MAGGHFRPLGDLWLSSIGLGTYLGDADDITDRGYEKAIRAALEAGCNVFDTAINYRNQRSEQAMGRALARAFDEGVAARDEVFVSTKAGFLPFDRDQPADPQAYWLRTYIETGLLLPADIAAGCHAIRPEFLADQLERSRRNLGLGTIDLFYLHNPETQIEDQEEQGWYRVGRALGWLGTLGDHIARFGVATWEGLRKPPGEVGHLSLAALAEAAQPADRSAGGPRLEAIQLPLNLAMPEAIAAPSQEFEGVTIPVVIAAAKLGLGVFTSASILQGRLVRALPPEVDSAFPGLDTDAQRALQFTRSAPGVTTALTGMSRVEHVSENLELSGLEPAGSEAFERLFTGSA